MVPQGPQVYDGVVQSVDGLHSRVIGYGTAVQEAISEEVDGLGQGYRLSDAAISKMVVDCLALHGAVRDSCGAGWAVAAPMLLRTQIELLLGCAAIVNAGDRSEILAYMYYFLSTKALLRTQGVPADTRKRHREEATRFLDYLPDHQRQEGRDFIAKGKLESYWYSPDYRGPTEILEAASTSEVQELYRALSGGVHGGTLGIRSWRDIPDMEHPGPRRDPAAQSRAVTGSCVITMQAIHMRFAHQGFTEDPILAELMEANRRNRDEVEALFAEAMRKAGEYVENNLRRRPDEGDEV